MYDLTFTHTYIREDVIHALSGVQNSIMINVCEGRSDLNLNNALLFCFLQLSDLLIYFLKY